jgi:hypothetical protein
MGRLSIHFTHFFTFLYSIAILASKYLENYVILKIYGEKLWCW